MRKKIITALLASMMTLAVGCSSNSNEDLKNDNNGTNDVSHLSQEELYEIHTNLFSKVEQLFKDENIEFVEMKDGKNTKYNETTKIRYDDSTNTTPGEHTEASYIVSFEENGDISSIGASLYLNIDSEEIKNNGFKFEDTSLYKLSNIMIDKDVDYTEINTKIVDSINDSNGTTILNDYDNINENITVSSDYIAYIVNIMP